MEMDLCWIIAAGGEPVKYFEKYPGRFPLVHVKDLKTKPDVTSGGEQNNLRRYPVDLTEVGSGVIDWKEKIFAHSQQAGIKHYIVEHDHPKAANRGAARRVTSICRTCAGQILLRTVPPLRRRQFFWGEDRGSCRFGALQTYDVCVIGSGASGGTAAKVLTGRRISVALLEAGPPLGPARDYKEHVSAVRPSPSWSWSGRAGTGRGLDGRVPGSEMAHGRLRSEPYVAAPGSNRWFRSRIQSGTNESLGTHRLANGACRFQSALGRWHG